MSTNYLQNLISQAKYLAEHNQCDSDKYLQIYEELSKHQNGIIHYEDPKTKEVTQESLSDRQIFQIRQQVLAYKYLIRNMNLPKDLEKNIYNLSKEQWEIESDRILQKSLKFYNEKVEKNHQLKQLIKEKIQKKESLQEQQEQTSQFFIEKKQYFIDKRKTEIQKVLQQSDWFSQECVRKLQLELHMLNQLDFHKKLQEKIGKRLLQNPENIPKQYGTQLLDRYFYKRDKPIRKHSEINMERFELNIRAEQNRRKKKKHVEFLQNLYQHQAEFYEFHRQLKKKQKKFCLVSQNWLQIREKKRQEQADKEMKERVRALRENDWAAYTKLIQDTKNSRITELLKKTDNYLRDLGKKVLLQKGERKEEEEEKDINKEKIEVENTNQYSLKDMTCANQDYYDLTHSVQESVIEQPSILVGGNLKNYQLIGLQWMVSLFNNKLNGILADEMGLGKTIQTISLFTYLVEVKKLQGPFLVVIPLSTMSNWVMEFEKWAPSLQVVSYKGTPGVRKDLSKMLKQNKWHVCLTTYDYILKDKQTLSKYQWKYIIVDEGHRMKNARSKFAQVLGQQYMSEYRILLTGTPLQNNLGELWALLNFLLPKVFKSCEEFEKWFSIPMQKVSTEKDQAALTEEEQLLIITRLHQVLRPFVLRRVKKEVEKELPDKVEYVIKVELSIWQKLQEKQIQQRQQNVWDPVSGKVMNKALMNLMMQLRKIANHPFLFLEDYGYEATNDMIWRVSGKFELLDRMIPKLKKKGHKILLFTQMTKLLNLLDHYFTYRGFRFLRLDGATKEDERGERMKAFNAKDSPYDIFMLSTRAGGLGLNLQTADTVIIFDSDWNPQQDLQAQDRAHRIGQKNEVRVLRLVTNTWIEKEILSKASQKIHLDDMIIQTAMYNNKATEADRQKKIEEMLGKNQKYEELDDDIPNDEQINDMLSRSEEEFEFYQEMDRQRYAEEKNLYKNYQDQDSNGEKGGPNMLSNIGLKEQTENDLEEDNNEDFEKKSYNYRLCEYEDVPEYIRNPPINENEIKVYGRGNRERKNVNYSDDVNEIRFLQSIAAPSDSEGEDGDDQQKENNAKKGRRGFQKKIQPQDEDGVVLEEDEEMENEDEFMKNYSKQFASNDLQPKQKQQQEGAQQEDDEDLQLDEEYNSKEQEKEKKPANVTVGRGRGRGRPPSKRGRKSVNNFSNRNTSVPSSTNTMNQRTTRNTRNSRRVVDSDEDEKKPSAQASQIKETQESKKKGLGEEEDEDFEQNDDESSGFSGTQTRRKSGRTLRSRAQNLDQLESQRKIKRGRLNNASGIKQSNGDYDSNNNNDQINHDEEYNDNLQKSQQQQQNKQDQEEEEEFD